MIAIVVTARPSYAKVKSVLAALVARHEPVTVIACASALLERYGKVVDVIRKDFPHVPIEEVWSTYEGSNLLTSAKETGVLLSDLAVALHGVQPSRVVVVADRHEVLGCGQAASYLHLPLVHLQGGERSGSIDDRVRDAITQLSDIHCVCTDNAKYRVYALTGQHDAIHVTGCPSIDLAKAAQCGPAVNIGELGGAGRDASACGGAIAVLQHPVTNEAACAAQQMALTLDSLPTNRPVIVLWPGQDAGSDAMAKVIRQHQDRVHTVRNLPPERFLRLLTQCAVLVGNSSAGIREASYLGTPVVDIGMRQWGRERAGNVIHAMHDRHDIAHAIDEQIEHGPYPSSTLYGDGTAGEKIAEVLCRS